MLPSPLVSVIIPTFNRVGFLQEAIDSVLAQRAVDFELLVVDDGSTDATPELCAAYGSRLHYVHQSRRGVSAARNHGLRRAQGELIAFLDSDDLWHPHKLARQVAWMGQHPQVRLCYTDEIWIRRGRRVNQKKIHQKAGGWIYPLCLPRCLISPSAVLLRRELFALAGVFDERLPICEDYDLWLRVAARFEVGFIAVPLITKRGGHAGQLSQSAWGLDRFRVVALLKMLASPYLQGEWRTLTVAELRRKCQILAAGCRKRGKIVEADYFGGLCHDPDQRDPDPDRLLGYLQPGAGTRQHDGGAL